MAARVTPAPHLLGLTSFLEGTDPACNGGGCVFFEGLPCLVESVNTFARPQCEELARSRTLEPLATWTVSGSPFERCSIDTGYLRRDVCDPAKQTVTFTLSRLR